jgi:hypothetical protein
LTRSIQSPHWNRKSRPQGGQQAVRSLTFGFYAIGPIDWKAVVLLLEFLDIQAAARLRASGTSEYVADQLVGDSNPCLRFRSGTKWRRDEDRMHYDLGYFDDEVGRLEPIANPFGPKVLPMSPE